MGVPEDSAGIHAIERNVIRSGRSSTYIALGPLEGLEGDHDMSKIMEGSI